MPQADKSRIDVDAADGVTTVRFDHAPVNALDLDLLEAVVETMRRIAGPLVITGAGRCFSAGVDLRAIIDGGPEYTGRFVGTLSEAFLAVFEHPAPVVAAINGHAIAGGCVFAMCADIRFMSTGTIGLTELAVGVPFPVAALEICRYAMGASVTRAALQPSTVDADTALSRRWIDAVIDDRDLLAEAVTTARTLGEHSPAAYAATKAQLHRPVRAAIDADAETDAQVRAAWIADDARKRISAFLDSLARGR